MNLNIELFDYLNPDDIRKIAEDELRNAFRAQFKTEADVERILVNLTYEYIHKLLVEQWDKDCDVKLRDSIIKVLENPDSIKYEVFRRKDVWNRSESPAVAILDDECGKSREKIRKSIDKIIEEYPFYEIQENIANEIYNCIMRKLQEPNNLNKF